MEWTPEELAQSVKKGSSALNVDIEGGVAARMASDSFNNIGILQALALEYFDACGIHERSSKKERLSSIDAVDDAGMAYADQLEAVYDLFAETVSEGIRKRKNATQIYAHALWAILEASDDELIKGLSIDEVFQRSHERQGRIQKPNLRSVLRKFKDIQVDDRGKGLVLVFDEATERVVVVDGNGAPEFRGLANRLTPDQRVYDLVRIRELEALGERYAGVNW